MKPRAALPLLLLLPFRAPLAAALLTVGPGGTHATVQAAVTAAVATPEDDELRLRAGTFFEHVDVGSSGLGGRLALSGGWDAAYAVRDPTPGATAIDGSSSGRAFTAAFVTAGELALEGLAFRNGLTDPAMASGGGLYLSAVDVIVTLVDCAFNSNLATLDDGSFSAFGGGALISAGGSADVRLSGVTFTGNRVFVDDTVGVPLGGGVYFGALDSARIRVYGGGASGNLLEGGATRRGAGFSAWAYGNGTIEIEDFVVTDNHADTLVAGTVKGHGVDLGSTDSGAITLARLAITENWNGPGDTTSQVHMLPSGGVLRVTDSLVARGGAGLQAGSTTATAHLSHLTVTDHDAYGLDLFFGAPGAGTVANTIAWDNAGGNLLLSGNAASGSFNLVGVDPLFVDAGNGDYRLAPLSPAIDAGTAAPPGGLGPFDLAHAPRVAGALPDQGAFEHDALFADGFERGDSRAWSATTP